MEQGEDRRRTMPWYDWLVFIIPTCLVVGLGLESVLGPDGVKYRDFRAVAHWFDPVFFQYNLIMTLLAVLVVPSLALSYIQTMTDRKEKQLQRDELGSKDQATREGLTLYLRLAADHIRAWHLERVPDQHRGTAGI